MQKYFIKHRKRFDYNSSKETYFRSAILKLFFVAGRKHTFATLGDPQQIIYYIMQKANFNKTYFK